MWWRTLPADQPATWEVTGWQVAQSTSVVMVSDWQLELMGSILATV